MHNNGTRVNVKKLQKYFDNVIKTLIVILLYHFDMYIIH